MYAFYMRHTRLLLCNCCRRVYNKLLLLLCALWDSSIYLGNFKRIHMDEGKILEIRPGFVHNCVSQGIMMVSVYLININCFNCFEEVLIVSLQVWIQGIGFFLLVRHFFFKFVGLRIGPPREDVLSIWVIFVGIILFLSRQYFI